MTIWRAAIVLIIICLLCICIVAADSSRFVIREYTIHSDKILQDCTFAVLADLHDKQYGQNNEKLLKAIESLKPDGIIIAGDMVTAREESDRTGTEALLAHLAQKFPVYYANGNHEYKLRTNKEKFGDAYERYADKLRQCHIVPMVNTRVVLPQYRINLCAIELERQFFRRFHKEEMTEEWLRERAGRADPDNFQILIAHNPEYFPRYAAWGAELVIAGHVHGGVARLPFLGGVISPSFHLFPKYDGGLFREGKSIMILSRGLGMHTIPVRFCNPGELIAVHLTHTPVTQKTENKD